MPGAVGAADKIVGWVQKGNESAMGWRRWAASKSY